MSHDLKRIDLFSPAIASVNAAGVVSPTAGLDVASIVGDWTLRCQVLAMTPGKTFRVAVEGSYDSFATVNTHMIACGAGTLDKATDRSYSARRYQLDSFAVVGYVDGKLRVNVVKFDPGSQLDLRVWLEHGGS